MEFMYKLKLINRLLDDSAWTDKDEEIVSIHFKTLQNLTENGIVILAGRTIRKDPSDFGIVILETESEDEAREHMKKDPAVKQGIMTAELYPFNVALVRSNTLKSVDKDKNLP